MISDVGETKEGLKRWTLSAFFPLWARLWN